MTQIPEGSEIDSSRGSAGDAGPGRRPRVWEDPRPHGRAALCPARARGQLRTWRVGTTDHDVGKTTCTWVTQRKGNLRGKRRSSPTERESRGDGDRVSQGEAAAPGDKEDSRPLAGTP